MIEKEFAQIERKSAHIKKELSRIAKEVIWNQIRAWNKKRKSVRKLRIK